MEPEPGQPDWRDGILWGTREIAQALGIILAGLVFSMAAVAVGVAISGVSLSDAQVAGLGLILTVVLDAALFGLATGFSVVKYRLPWRALGFRPLSLGRSWIPAATVVAVFFIVGGYGLLVQLIGVDKLVPQGSLGDDITDNRALVALAGVLVVLLAPVVEETFFRGFLFSGLAKRFGFLWAALASGLLFSVAHGQPTTFIPFTLVGVLFAWVYVYTGSLWTTIGAHFTWNLISFILLLVA
jgi:membrane protease YdiL (CAAX protease family)